MNQISSLDSVFKVFEAFGLQNFSLKLELSLKPNKRRAFWSKLHLMFVWSFLSLALFVFLSNVDLEDPDLQDANSLHLFLKCLALSSILGSVYSGLAVTLVRNCCFIKFFKSAEKISKISSQEFQHEANYSKLKRTLGSRMIVFVLQLVSAIIYVTFTAYVKGGVEHFFYLILVTSLLEVLVLIFIKFNFYIWIINFQLILLLDLMGPFDRRTQILLGSNRPNETRKVLAIRKIFCLIVEMADQVNRSMGVIMLFFLMLAAVSFIRNGYKIFMILAGHDGLSVQSE